MASAWYRFMRTNLPPDIDSRAVSSGKLIGRGLNKMYAELGRTTRLGVNRQSDGIREPLRGVLALWLWMQDAAGNPTIARTSNRPAARGTQGSDSRVPGSAKGSLSWARRCGPSPRSRVPSTCSLRSTSSRLPGTPSSAHPACRPTPAAGDERSSGAGHLAIAMCHQFPLRTRAADVRGLDELAVVLHTRTELFVVAWGSHHDRPRQPHPPRDPHTCQFLPCVAQDGGRITQ